MSTELEEIAGKRTATLEFLLTNARQPLSATAKDLGISVEEVAVKYDRFFQDYNWRSIRQEEVLLIVELEDMIRDAKERFDEAKDVPEYAALLNAVLKAYGMIAGRLDARKKVAEEDFSKLTHFQARIMGQAIRLAQDMAIFEIRKSYPDLDPDVAEAAFDAALPLAVKQLESAQQ